jgi:tetratricopeptide (TPR) repeat protein
MHSFLWTGKDEHGNEKRDIIHAENAEASRAILTARGWTELRLLRDEVGDAARGLVVGPHRAAIEQQRKSSPGRPRYLASWGDSLLRLKWILLVQVLLLVIALYQEHWIAVVVSSSLLAVTILLFPAIAWYYRRGSREFARLNEARLWGRWPEVLKSVERLRHVRNRTRIGLNDWELARIRAVAMAGMGRLDEGLREFKSYENSSVVPRWMYLSLLANVYSAANQHEKALELHEQAVAEKSDNATLWIGLAGAYVRRLDRPADARVALARAEALPQTELGAAYMDFTRGLIAWREGNLEEARTRIESALKALQAQPRKRLMVGTMLLMQSHLAAVLAAIGNTDVARKFFAKNKPYLVAHHEEELLRIADSLERSKSEIVQPRMNTD